MPLELPLLQLEVTAVRLIRTRELKLIEDLSDKLVGCLLFEWPASEWALLALILFNLLFQPLSRAESAELILALAALLWVTQDHHADLTCNHLKLLLTHS